MYCKSSQSGRHLSSEIICDVNIFSASREKILWKIFTSRLRMSFHGVRRRLTTETQLSRTILNAKMRLRRRRNLNELRDDTLQQIFFLRVFFLFWWRTRKSAFVDVYPHKDFIIQKEYFLITKLFPISSPPSPSCRSEHSLFSLFSFVDSLWSGRDSH